VREVGELGDLVVGDVQDAQIFVGLETCDGGQSVVADVELFERG